MRLKLSTINRACHPGLESYQPWFRMEDLEDLEDWKIGRLEDWKIGRSKDRDVKLSTISHPNRPCHTELESYQPWFRLGNREIERSAGEATVSTINDSNGPCHQ